MCIHKFVKASKCDEEPWATTTTEATGPGTTTATTTTTTSTTIVANCAANVNDACGKVKGQVVTCCNGMLCSNKKCVATSSPTPEPTRAPTTPNPTFEPGDNYPVACPSNTSCLPLLDTCECDKSDRLRCIVSNAPVSKVGGVDANKSTSAYACYDGVGGYYFGLWCNSSGVGIFGGSCCPEGQANKNGLCQDADCQLPGGCGN